MKKTLLFLTCAFAAVAQDYKLEPITAAPQGLPSAYTALIPAQGYRVSGPKGTWCEVWFRKSIPAVTKPSDPTIVFPFAQGTLLGVIRFPAEGSDRRGQTFKAGLYTMRYSNYPVDGAHQGVAPQRDFALLTPIANDTDPNAMPAFDKLVTASRTTGTAHPCVFSLEPPPGTAFPAVVKDGDTDWVLEVKVGDQAIGLIVVGTVGG
ncbi:MAG TPA: hypothetical protein VME43_19375 [Bryobacteraceae bacterium]|nr:hypothetical protein [Bryobacteraceae bacterium]